MYVCGEIGIQLVLIFAECGRNAMLCLEGLGV